MVGALISETTLAPDIETVTSTLVPLPMHISWTSIPNSTQPASNLGFYPQDM